MLKNPKKGFHSISVVKNLNIMSDIVSLNIEFGFARIFLEARWDSEKLWIVKECWSECWYYVDTKLPTYWYY